MHVVRGKCKNAVFPLIRVAPYDVLAKPTVAAVYAFAIIAAKTDLFATLFAANNGCIIAL